MKNLIKLLGIIAVVAIIGISMASCASFSSVGAAAGPHGFFTGNGASSDLISGAQVVSSYSVWLGLFDTGYEQYASSVKTATESGKVIFSVTKSYFNLFTKTTAYAK